MKARKPSRIGAAIRKHCLSYPKSEESFPWGESAFKVVAALPEPPKLFI